MGTRSITLFREKQNDRFADIASMYRQFDGYPACHGQELCEYLAGGVLVDGLSSRDEGRKVYNTMGCLAASVVGAFKEEPGGIYLCNPADYNQGQDFTYVIREGKIRQPPIIEIWDGRPGTGTKLGEHTPAEWLKENRLSEAENMED